MRTRSLFANSPRKSLPEKGSGKETLPQPNDLGPAVPMTLRALFQTVAGGVYGAALAHLLQGDLADVWAASASASDLRALSDISSHDLRPRAPHFPAKARSVIQLFMN